jgi:hypothetical protein
MPSSSWGSYLATPRGLEPLDKHLVAGGRWLVKHADAMWGFRSLGGMFSAVSEQLFGDPMEAGKVMGLAPYGRAAIAPEAFFALADGLFSFHDDVPARFPHRDRWPRHEAAYADLAASTQAALEVALMSVTRRLQAQTGAARLCYAGGVALNGIANQRLLRERVFDELHVIPAAEDSGVAIDRRLELGELTLRTTELLETGAVRAIHPGRALIHAAFHLDDPSVTLVVRSHADASPELEYKPPGLALDPSARDARATKLLQLMSLLARRPGDGYRRRVASALAGCDAYTGVLLLLRARQQTDPETFAALLDGFRHRFPVLAARLAAVAGEEAQRFAVTAARARITDPDHRFLLALVMNLPDRDAILGAIRQRYPARDPIAQLLGWLRACGRRDRLGFELDDPLMAILRSVIEGRAPEQLRLAPGTTQAELARAIQALQRIPVLAPLFRRAAFGR